MGYVGMLVLQWFWPGGGGGVGLDPCLDVLVPPRV